MAGAKGATAGYFPVVSPRSNQLPGQLAVEELVVFSLACPSSCGHIHLLLQLYRKKKKKKVSDLIS